MMRVLGCLIICLFLGSCSENSTLEGLWEVEKVQVGSENMTPVSKWFDIKENGTYTGGNGWLQNDIGTWTFDSEQHQYLPTSRNGLSDPFGAFQVALEPDNMTWTREEEGMEVIVHLNRIEEKPMSPQDNMIGLWDLISADSNGTDILKRLDPQGKRNLHIRWDHIYRDTNPGVGRKTGFWIMHAHRPDLSLLPHDQKSEQEYWKVSIKDSKLNLEGNAEANRGITLTFKRLSKFPD